MKPILTNLFFASSALLLLLTGLAKLYSVFGRAKMLQVIDPLLMVRYQHLLLLVGLLEIILVGVLCSRYPTRVKLLGLFWLSANFMLYRITNWLFGIPMASCPCQGSLTDQLHLDRVVVNQILMGMVLYLFAGSLLGLLWERRQRVFMVHCAPGEKPVVEAI
jgi:hypothetical protein